MANAVFGRTVGNLGLVNFKSNADLEAESNAAYEAQQAAQNPPRHIAELAGYIRTCWDKAERHKANYIAERLLDCQRRRKGQYDPTKLAKIRNRGGCETFFNITDTKAGAAEASIGDIVRPARGDIWKFETTPVPDLPEDVKTQIVALTLERFGLARSMGDIIRAEDVREFALGVLDQQTKAIKKEADKRAERMSVKVADQLTEGGWEAALDGFIRDLCTYPSAILKGPVVKRVKRQKWVGEEATTVYEEVPMWEVVSPHDFYPAPNAKNCQSSYICEVARLEKAELAKLREVEGYNADAINAVLSDTTDGVLAKMVSPTTESERAELEDRDASINAGLPEGVVQAIEFWGNVQGKLLAEWGMEVEDENDYYHICALLIGEHVVRAILNPDPLGQNPYFVTSYELVSGDIWGRAISEKMADCQDAVNDCLRAAINNLALASGPMVYVDIDALDPSIDPTDIYPWKVWQGHGTRTPGRNPVDFFQPTAMEGELQAAAEYFEQKADDRTLIPRYAHGNMETKDAASTASGLNMLMTAGAKGTMRVIGNLDRDVIRPAIEHQYRWDLVYLDDADWKAAKGDIRIVPQGQLAAIVREQTQQLRQQFLANTMNPLDQQIVGIKERATIWRVIARDLGLPVDDVVRPEQEILRSLQGQNLTPEDMAMQQGGMPQPQEPPAPVEPEAALATGGEPLPRQLPIEPPQ